MFDTQARSCSVVHMAHMAAAAKTRKVFKVVGTTDQVTECGHCGRIDLKGTIILGELDEDGTIGVVTYFGSVCGAKAAGWTIREIRKAAKNADAEWADSWRLAHRENGERTEAAFLAKFIPWVNETYGVTIRSIGDLNHYRHAIGGKTAYTVRVEFETSAS